MAAGFWLAAAPAAQGATDAIDQSQLITGSSVTVTNTQMMAQTITAGMTGQLDRVSLFMGYQFSIGGGVLQIQSVAAGTGQPSGTVLGATAYSGSAFTSVTWHDIALSPAVPVTSGTQYAIVVIPSSAPGTTSWVTSTAIKYTAGKLWVAAQATSTWGTLTRSFVFETWVASGVTANPPPVVSAASNSVSVNEGGVASNSGGYSDPDGDTVSLTASAGTVTQTGSASSGTWSWTQTAADEGPAQSITITANDGHGNTATTTFGVIVATVAPTAKISGAPASSLEGATVSLTGSATSPSAADTAAGFTYSWTVTKNGAAFASGSGAAFNFQPNDEGTYVVIMTATDDGAASGTASATLQGTNVAPTATITSTTSSGAAIMPNQGVTFAGHFSDPGTGDSHTVTWTFGDGASNTTSFGPGGAADFTITHAYAKSGTYDLGLEVVDDDGGMGYATAKVVVGSPAQAIADMIEFVKDLTYLKRGQMNSLVRKLDSAGRALQRGDTEAACEQLSSFLERVAPPRSRDGEDNDEDEVHQSHGQLRTADAAALAAATRSVMTALGCNSNQNSEH